MMMGKEEALEAKKEYSSAINIETNLTSLRIYLHSCALESNDLTNWLSRPLMVAKLEF
jgi:hypothetical protein